MGNNYSDQSTAATPDSPSVLYTMTDGVHFRNVRGQYGRDDYDILSFPSQQKGSGVPVDDVLHNGVDAPPLTSTDPLVGRRSPAVLKRQLTIDIPLDQADGANRRATVSSTGSDFDIQLSSSISPITPRYKDSDRLSLGAFSMKPNYSPRSLYEKNLRLSDTDQITNVGIQEVDDGDPQNVFTYSTDSYKSDNVNENRRSDSSDSTLGKSNHTDDMHSCTSDLINTDADNISEYFTCTEQSESVPLLHDTSDTSWQMISPSSHALSESSSNVKHSTPQTDDKGETKLPPAIERILSEQSLSFKRTVSPQESSQSHSSVSEEASFASDIDVSESSKDLTFSKTSLDLSENASGIATPDSELFNPGEVGLKTAVSISTLQHELESVYQDLDDLTSKMDALNYQTSREDVSIVPDVGMFHQTSLKGAEFCKALRVLKRHKSRDENSFCRSHSASDEWDSELDDSKKEDSQQDDSKADSSISSDKKQWRKSYHHSGEFMWDYGSDLAAVESQGIVLEKDQFVSHRPMLGRLETVEDTEDQATNQVPSPTFEHVRAYLRSLDSTVSLDLTNMTSASSRQESVADIYIDDEFSGLNQSPKASLDSKESSPDLGIHGLSQAGTLSDLEFTSDFASSVESRSPRAYSSHRGSVDSMPEDQALGTPSHTTHTPQHTLTGEYTNEFDHL